MYKNNSDYEFIQSLEENWQVIKQELEQLSSNDFLDWPEKHLYGKGWQTFGLYAFGMKLGKNCQICPETTKLVEKIPNMVTAGFSSLVPGTHIAAHTGYPDGVLRCHLGLIGCDGCSLRVGDEIRNWQEGKCFVFDDTTEHEAWNRGDRTRVVLLIDFKPDSPIAEIKEIEKGAKTDSKGFWQTIKGIVGAKS
ncbi:MULTISPECIES: aspartyl/asparaginyl beta-hydroxylase domain-containing protein [Pseudanabaena]|uniref:Aspartyl/Asparaginyl beta-hydroxylase n=2 Tax=Pseudanabaena TaxID=1152 RepID=L8N3L0_9CYAN|nr:MULTISPECIES: aspartyl/asparaginyl beta-hydroxylase domain-containing protein [Pseudanabaena]ELS33285.1 Aspartyl/Asparaginyl beta-hydroxylase [Pseudanabaena biceps PCC 7429]MDG3494505.1 aspartyl/asparaginyl beta-hydroxylase domain-containing protein [Pseudanabaena catenata USMAC16]